MVVLTVLPSDPEQVHKQFTLTCVLLVDTVDAGSLDLPFDLGLLTPVKVKGDRRDRQLIKGRHPRDITTLLPDRIHHIQHKRIYLVRGLLE